MIPVGMVRLPAAGVHKPKGRSIVAAVFSVFPIVFGLVFLVVVIGAIVHMIAFGALFGAVAKRIADAAQQQRAIAAADATAPCAYCGVAFPAVADQCPSCGARRRDERVTGASAMPLASPRRG
jgi:hypothetical protein